MLLTKKFHNWPVQLTTKTGTSDHFALSIPNSRQAAATHLNKQPANVFTLAAAKIKELTTRQLRVIPLAAIAAFSQKLQNTLFASKKAAVMKQARTLPVLASAPKIQLCAKTIEQICN